MCPWWMSVRNGSPAVRLDDSVNSVAQSDCRRVVPLSLCDEHVGMFSTTGPRTSGLPPLSFCQGEVCRHSVAIGDGLSH